MKRIKFLISFGLIATLILSLMMVTPAKAVGPEFVDEPVDESFVVGGSVENCGFPIVQHNWGIWSYKVFFDKDGIPVKLLINIPDWHKTWTGPSGTSQALFVHGPYELRLNKDGSLVDNSVGVNEFLTLPGYGPVYGFAGHIRGDLTNGYTLLKAVGSIIDPPDWDAICAYFAP